MVFCFTYGKAYQTQVGHYLRATCSLNRPAWAGQQSCQGCQKTTHAKQGQFSTNCKDCLDEQQTAEHNMLAAVDTVNAEHGADSPTDAP